MKHLDSHQGATFLKKGDVIAYPTEAVYGLGCCPFNEKALQQVLTLKQRPSHKGLILIASSVEQVIPFIDFTLCPKERLDEIAEKYWPGPHTFVFPASDKVHPLVKGTHPTVALRVTAHPIVRQLCEAFGGAIVSTSANVADSPAFKNANEVDEQFGASLAGIVEGKLGGSQTVTSIHHALSGEQYRA